jgi:multisubunit Na+/H+ antiporter MnhB subunit
VLLGVGIATAAVLCLIVRDRITGIVLFVVFGLLVSGAYARLAAPDVALAEAAIGTAVTGALLLGAVQVGRTTRAAAARSRGRVAVAAVTAVVGALVVGSAVAALLTRPAAPGLGPRVTAAVPDSGVEHPVTAVLLVFRAYDTLLEVVVVLLAALVALALLPGRRLPVPPRPPEAVEPLAFLLRVLVPVGVLVAGWLLYIGAYQPGGAFQAGAVLAGVLVLLLVAGRRTSLPPRLLAGGLVAGAGVFLAVGVAGLLLRGRFLDYGPLATAAVIAVETAIALSVGVTLAALYLARRPVTERSRTPQQHPSGDEAAGGTP